MSKKDILCLIVSVGCTVAVNEWSKARTERRRFQQSMKDLEEQLRHDCEKRQEKFNM